MLDLFVWYNFHKVLEKDNFQCCNFVLIYDIPELQTMNH